MGQALNQSSTMQHDLSDIDFMALALAQARLAAQAGEVPVGAVVVQAGKVIGVGFNCPIGTHDASAHAEIMAIRQACQTLNNYRLPDCDLYVTLEPCTMCAGAMIHARIKRLIYGANEPKAGIISSHLGLLQQPFFNHAIATQGGVMAEEAGQLLSNFFKQRRLQKTAAKEKSY